MTVYLDIIFLENILMNYIILTATGIVTKSGGKLIKTRMLLSSILGSTYATIMYLKPFKFYQNFFAKIILSIIMVCLALIPKSTKEFIKKLVLFYLISFPFDILYNIILFFNRYKKKNAHIILFIYTFLYVIH